MKRITTSILSFIGLTMLITSCISGNNSTTDFAEWKTSNDSYFTNMKDSTGYVLYNIPDSSGGYSYYYKVTTPGDQSSVSPLSTDQVTVNYRGKLINGYVFDQTYTGSVISTGTTPSTFYPKSLIPGWTQNLMQMKVGEIRTFVLPQELAYGTAGSGAIYPYSTTIWVVQLVSVVH